MPRTARVITTFVQEIEISDDYALADKQEVLNFLAEYQNLGEFIGITNGDETMRITAVQVLEDDVESIDVSKED